MKQNILGLDVGKASAVGYCLDSLPTDISRHWKKLKALDFYTLKCDRSGFDQLHAIAPSAIALEPTGTHYSTFWSRIAESLGIEVLWVGHVEVRHYRLSHKLPSKNDRADAYALACYGLTHQFDPGRFGSFDVETVELRQTLMELQSIYRFQTGLINRTRQQLSHEFPEAAYKKSEFALWRWLAGEEVGYYDRLHEASIVRDVGLDVSPFTRGLAQQIVHLKKMEVEAEFYLQRLLDWDGFASYKEVFDRFGFGDRLSAAILVNTYPIERFSQWDGSRSRWNSKAFKLKLGMGLIEQSSGDKVYFAPGGSVMCRKLFYLWAVTRIASPINRPDGDLAQDAIAYYERLKVEMPSKQLARLRLCKIAARSSRVLFRELLAATKVNA